ncbi:MAG: hypothetical protein ABEJ46_05260 [Gemmatimonadota bacterium]
MMSTADRSLRFGRSLLLSGLTVAALVGLTACGGGGGSDAGSASDTASLSGMPSGRGPQQGGVRAELQQVQQELSRIRKRAMKDTALRQQMQEVQGLIQKTMREMSPQAAQQMNRMDSLRGELRSAQSGGDTARLRSLMMEMQKLQRSLKRLQAKAMKEENVARAVKEFERALREKMRQMNPATDSLRQRADSLRQQMRSRMQGMQGRGGPADTAGS